MGLAPTNYTQVFLRVTAVYAHSAGAGEQPDASASDYDPRLAGDIRATLASTPWGAIVTDIEVREEWHGNLPPSLSVALYARQGIVAD